MSPIDPETKRHIINRVAGVPEATLPTAEQAARDATARRILVLHLRGQWAELQTMERKLSAHKRVLWDLLHALEQEPTQTNKKT